MVNKNLSDSSLNPVWIQLDDKESNTKLRYLEAFMINAEPLRQLGQNLTIILNSFSLSALKQNKLITLGS